MYYVRDDAKKAATKCNKDFVCLSKNGNGMSGIISSIDTDLYVTCKDSQNCGYGIAHNGRTLCMCPVRGEIYSKYDV